MRGWILGVSRKTSHKRWFSEELTSVSRVLMNVLLSTVWRLSLSRFVLHLPESATQLQSLTLEAFLFSESFTRMMSSLHSTFSLNSRANHSNHSLENTLPLPCLSLPWSNSHGKHMTSSPLSASFVPALMQLNVAGGNTQLFALSTSLTPCRRTCSQRTKLMLMFS